METRENLEHTLEIKKETLDKVYTSMIQSLTNIMETLKTELGLTELAYDVSLNHIECLVPYENKNGKVYNHPFDIYINDHYRHLNVGERKIELNTSCFGSFDYTSKGCVNYYVYVGKIVDNLERITNMIHSLDWNTYDMVAESFYTAKNALDKYDRDIEEINNNKKKDEIRSKISVGTKIRTRKADSSKWYGEKIDEIDWISKSGKNVTFVNYYKRIPMECILNYISNGAWELIEKE